MKIQMRKFLAGQLMGRGQFASQLLWMHQLWWGGLLVSSKFQGREGALLISKNVRVGGGQLHQVQTLNLINYFLCVSVCVCRSLSLSLSLSHRYWCSEDIWASTVWEMWKWLHSQVRPSCRGGCRWTIQHKWKRFARTFQDWDRMRSHHECHSVLQNCCLGYPR
jgi:hypothetical protein